MNFSREKLEINSAQVAQLRAEITAVWLASTRASDDSARAKLLALYRDLRRRYELARLLGQADLA